jgi:DNA recombination protein RmuC
VPHSDLALLWVGLGAGFVAGVGLAALLGARRVRRLVEDNASLRETAAALRAQADRAPALTALVEGRERALRDSFAALSTEALREAAAQLAERAEETFARLEVGGRAAFAERQRAVEELVQPLGEALARLDEEVRRLERERARTQGELVERLEALTRAERDLRRETAELARALRSPGARGRWGELQLRRALELAGLTARCDFVEQQTFSDEAPDREGDCGRRRPDVVVHLPGGRRVAVDAKAPLEAYLASLDATDEPARRDAVRAHARAIREHARALAARAYWRHLQPAPELVVLFLPIEAAWAAALEHDPSLLEPDGEGRVVIATPTTLIALLKAIALGWQQATLGEEAAEVARLGRALHGRIAGFLDHFAALRRGLVGALEGYNRAAASLEARVLPTARRLSALGASASASDGARGELEIVRPIDDDPRAAPRAADDAL